MGEVNFEAVGKSFGLLEVELESQKSLEESASSDDLEDEDRVRSRKQLTLSSFSEVLSFLVASTFSSAD